MSLWILNVPSVTLSQVTLADMARRVARIAGEQEGGGEDGAIEAIQEIIWELNG